MIFLTVGTQFPFDRLVKSLDQAFDEGLIDEEVFAQIGQSSYHPRNFDSVTTLDKDLFDKHLEEASSIISHAGMGTITMAFENKKPLLVMPRLAKYGEVVNDHQKAIAKKFSELGYLLVAYDVEDLPEGVRKLKNFVPNERRVDPKPVADRIHLFLESLQD
jgi:UDP-N-acetylglucosamine transferase subunit ALG13